MAGRSNRRPRPPLDEERLNELMMAYVARFATSRSKLKSYLMRKVRERGWAGAGEPPVEALAEKAVGAGFVDDAAFALAKSRSLAARGYGEHRLTAALRAAGIGQEEAEAAHSEAREQAVEAALQFARRRRLGPFALSKPDPRQCEKQLAAMLRAGHGLSLARKILAMEPGSALDRESLQDFS